MRSIKSSQLQQLPCARPSAWCSPWRRHWHRLRPWLLFSLSLPPDFDEIQKAALDYSKIFKNCSYNTISFTKTVSEQNNLNKPSKQNRHNRIGFRKAFIFRNVCTRSFRHALFQIMGSFKRKRSDGDDDDAPPIHELPKRVTAEANHHSDANATAGADGVTTTLDTAFFAAHGYVVVPNVLLREELQLLQQECALLYARLHTDEETATAMVVEQVRSHRYECVRVG